MSRGSIGCGAVAPSNGPIVQIRQKKKVLGPPKSPMISQQSKDSVSEATHVRGVTELVTSVVRVQNVLCWCHNQRSSQGGGRDNLLPATGHPSIITT